MLEKINKFKGLAFSASARDTYILFAGNVFSAFTGFLFTLIVARKLTLADFGVFSAASNLVTILISLVDFGIAAGAVNFISKSFSQNDKKSENSYIKAAVFLKLLFTILISLIIALFAGFISTRLLATNDPGIALLTALISLSFSLPVLFPYILRAQRRFFASVIVENSIYIFRLAAAVIFAVSVGLTLKNSLYSFILGGALASLYGLYLIKVKFLKAATNRDIYKTLVVFSGWIGVNTVVSSISGRMDVQMIAAMLGAVDTGIYAIPNRLAGFIVLLAASYSGVLAPRIAGFSDKESIKKYIQKSGIGLVAIIAAIVFWIIIAGPFIQILFGDKFLPGVKVFQALAASYIPFLLTVPSVTAIIYGMKKTSYIGLFAFFQLIFLFSANLFFIPKYGIFGPTISNVILNCILAAYSWFIVYRYYWK